MERFDAVFVIDYAKLHSLPAATIFMPDAHPSDPINNCAGGINPPYTEINFYCRQYCRARIKNNFEKLTTKPALPVT